MIYADTSVLLARLLAEEQIPPDLFWEQSLIASRLVEYEVWTRLHARKLAATHGEAARSLLGRVALAELAPPLLARALEPFPTPVRTLDTIHLATFCFLKDSDPDLVLATYDARLAAAARGLKFRVVHP